MGSVRFDALTVADALVMAKNMRPMDVLECNAMAPATSLEDVMLHMQKRSSEAYAVFVGDDLLCCFGRIDRTALSGECNPWMVATPFVETARGRRVMVSLSKSVIARMVKGFSRSWNFVYEGNTTTIRWLKWVGFVFDGEPKTIGGHTFLPFEIKGELNVY